MLFSSQPFLLLFLPLSLLTYYLVCEHRTARTAVLCAVSLSFYAWWDPRFVPLLGGLILLTWLAVKLHARTEQRFILWIGVLANLLALGFFKYTNFLAETVLDAVGVVHQPWNIILPLGISFFTFQQVSYLVDRARGEAPVYGLLEYAAFVSFFPQLIAGPIVRHNQLIGQFAASPKRPGLLEDVARGLILFTLGLIKKVFYADELAPIADSGFAALDGGVLINSGDAWLASLAYSLQLYFDFSAYSDMAIGLGALFGLKLPINFDRPYQALHIRDFWRRWHITLSNFLRDYVYIPLGGSRGNAAKTYFTVMVTMLLCGMWHGAGWTFIAWGALHGLGICISRGWSDRGLSLPLPLAWLTTMLFVICGWVLFRAESFTDAYTMLQSMFLFAGAATLVADGEDILFVTIGAMFAIVGPSNAMLASRARALRRPIALATGAALVLLTLRVGQGRGLEFIYFQF